MNRPGDAPDLVGMAGDSLREAFGRALVELGKTRQFVVFDADVAGGTGTHHFRRHFVDRFFQCGIAEQNMASLAAGFSATGIPVFLTTFSVFCLRAIEQIRLSVCLAKRNVKIVGSHCGLDVGPDGPSAQCLEDLAMFRALPNLVVVVPADPLEVGLATEAVLDHPGPVYMRTGRSPCPRMLEGGYRFRLGKGSLIAPGSDLTVMSCGPLLAEALDARNQLASLGLSARVVNMSTLKPIDMELVEQCARDTGCLVTVEDHSVIGGLGGAIAEALVTGLPSPLERVGVCDRFGESGEPRNLWEKFNLTASAIVRAAQRAVQRKNQQ